RAVEAAHRHQAAGHVFVAAGQRDECVVPLAAHDRFDGIGDEVAGLQRIAHPLGPHADAVGDAHGVEPHADQAYLIYARLDLLGQTVEVHVAGISLVPDAGDPDLGLVHVLRLQAGAIEHRLAGPLAFGLGDVATVF